MDKRDSENCKRDFSKLLAKVKIVFSTANSNQQQQTASLYAAMGSNTLKTEDTNINCANGCPSEDASMTSNQICLIGVQHNIHHKGDQPTSAMNGYLGSCWTRRERRDRRS